MKGLLFIAVCLGVLVGSGEAYHRSAETESMKPVFLSGNAAADWRAHAATASVCVADEMPSASILAGWKRLGVTMLRRAAWDPEGSAEFFRRQAGFLPFHERADGVWLEGEANFPETWKRALAEAKTDVEVAQYLDSLADEAVASGDHRLVLEGRRVKWMFDQLDYASTDLDRLRLEFVAAAKFLEEALGKPAKDLPTSVPAAIEPDVARFRPEGAADAKKIDVQSGQTYPLSDGMTFFYDARFFVLNIPTAVRGCRVRLYLPGHETGSLVPYEYVFDFSEPDAGPRAPVIGRGLFSLVDRFGGRYPDADRRVRCVQRRSWSPAAPELHPHFEVKGEGKARQAVFTVDWMNLYGLWPMQRPGKSDVWHLIVDRLPDGGAQTFKLVWPRGNTSAFDGFCHSINSWRMSERYKGAVAKARGLFLRSAAESRYGTLPAKAAGCRMFDVASDAMFVARCIEPKVRANADLAKAVDVPNICEEPKYLKGDKTYRGRIWRALGRLLYFGHEADLARRDYLALRFDGKEPPEPKAEKKVETPRGPSLSADDDAIELDDKEF